MTTLDETQNVKLDEKDINVDKTEFVIDENVVEEIQDNVVVKKARKAYTRKNKSDVLVKSEGNVDVVFKQKTGKVARQRVVIYKEDIQPLLPEVVLEVKNKAKGRPKKQQMTVVEEINKEEDIVISRTKPVKPMTDTELKREAKRLDLLEKVIKIEQITGKTVKLNKDGEVKVRSFKQREATQKLVLANEVRRAVKQKEKLDAIQAEQSAQVLNIIQTLSKAKSGSTPAPVVQTKQWNL